MIDPLRSLETFVGAVGADPLAVVATVSAAGEPEAALVSIAVTAQGDLLFSTRTAARKVANLGHRARAAVVIGCTGPVSLQVEGDAAVESGADRLVAGRFYTSTFPGSRALDDGFSLVRIRPDWIRRYDTGTEPPEVLEGRPDWAG